MALAVVDEAVVHRALRIVDVDGEVALLALGGKEGGLGDNDSHALGDCIIDAETLVPHFGSEPL